MEIAANSELSTCVEQRADMLLLRSSTSKKQLSSACRDSENDVLPFRDEQNVEPLAQIPSNDSFDAAVSVEGAAEATAEPYPSVESADQTSHVEMPADEPLESEVETERHGLEFVYGSRTVMGFMHANEDRLAMAVLNFSPCSSPPGGGLKRHSFLQPAVASLGSAGAAAEHSGRGKTTYFDAIKCSDGTPQNDSKKQGYVWICCDGHDGPQAADFFIQNFPGTFQRMLLTKRDFHRDADIRDSPRGQLSQKIRTSMVVAHLETDGSFRNWVDARASLTTRCTSGTCVTSVFMCGTQIWFANLGDCTAWILQRRKTPLKSSKDGFRDSRIQFTRATTDHRASQDSERARIYKLHGSIICGRVRGLLEPSRTIGDFDVKDSQPPGVISCIPALKCFDVDGPVLVLLGTDGIWDVMREEQIVSALSDAQLWENVVSWLTVREDLEGGVNRPEATPTEEMLGTICDLLISRARHDKSEDDASCSVIHVAPWG